MDTSYTDLMTWIHTQAFGQFHAISGTRYDLGGQWLRFQFGSLRITVAVGVSSGPRSRKAHEERLILLRTVVPVRFTTFGQGIAPWLGN
jgi:hypothetical protein